MSGKAGISPYLRLVRLHQPAGILLLLWPCWWSVALSSHGAPPLRLLVLFALGAILMRSAGCIVNDLADRTFDAQVARTKTRPLASGELKPFQAIALLIALLALALLVAIALGWPVVLWAALSLPLVAIYPWMKRVSWWPQLFLGLAFNWGAWMGWAAVAGAPQFPAFLLYVGGIFWTLGYDTIYAHQDKADDQKIGVKSLALRLGKNSRNALAGFYTLAMVFFILAGMFSRAPEEFYTLILASGCTLFWQVFKADFDSPDSCRRMFLLNAYGFGILTCAAMLAA